MAILCELNSLEILVQGEDPVPVQVAVARVTVKDHVDEVGDNVAQRAVEADVRLVPVDHGVADQVEGGHDLGYETGVQVRDAIGHCSTTADLTQNDKSKV